MNPELYQRCIMQGSELGLVKISDDGNWTLTDEYCKFLDSIPQQLERPDLAEVKKTVHQSPNSATVLGYFTVAYLNGHGFKHINFDTEITYEFAQLISILDFYLEEERIRLRKSKSKYS